MPHRDLMENNPVIHPVQGKQPGLWYAFTDTILIV